ncbi:hypothetical protein GCM10008957_43040 [Deinococcus ruber]|uniref:Major facilitator superfamily (MFS) profile domain-containing protein n=2 Tax=Deinococcus ruber TaxID=1848197 RepID=A0A918FE12_9DEIO|nr:hypothetical protein [Deinococcus ruber]GGR27088.1 hypothetical protein GCM10008957_43040 [Deinococcus ruber]
MIFTPLLHRLGAQTLTVWLLGCLGIGTLLLHVAGVLALAVAGIVLFGMANGALTLARSELLVLAYRPEDYGTANGRLARPVNLAQALTPFGMGLLFTLTGGYGWSLTVLAGLAGVSILKLLRGGAALLTYASEPPLP